jgi:hypothetical protein
VTISDKVVRATNEAEAGGPSQPSDKESSPMAYLIPTEVPSSKPTGLRGRNLFFSSTITADKVKPRRPFTRAAAKKNVPVKNDATKTLAQEKGKSQTFKQPIENFDITTPQHESNPTFKRLKR